MGSLYSTETTSPASFLRRLGSPACRARSIIARQRRCVLKISPRGRFSRNVQPATHNSREVDRSPIRTFSPRLFSHGRRMLATVDCFCSSTETKRRCPHALYARAPTPALAHECPVGNWITRSSCLKVEAIRATLPPSKRPISVGLAPRPSSTDALSHIGTNRYRFSKIASGTARCTRANPQCMP